MCCEFQHSSYLLPLIDCFWESNLEHIFNTFCVSQFEDVLNLPDPKEHLRKLVDPHLGDDYPFDSVWKVKQLIQKPIITVFL